MNSLGPTFRLLVILIAWCWFEMNALGQEVRHELNENVFLFNALENLVRETFTDAKHEKGMTSGQVMAFVRAKAVLADEIRLHVKLTQLEPELLTLYGEYNNHLASLELFAGQLKEREDQYRKFLVDLQNKVFSEEMRRRSESTVRVLEAGVSMGMNTWGDPFDQFLGGVLGSFAQAAAENARNRNLQRQALEKAAKLAGDYEKANLPKLRKVLATMCCQYLPELRRLQQSLAVKADNACKAFAQKQGLKPNELGFDPFCTFEQLGVRKRLANPFHFEQVLLSLPKDKNSDLEEQKLQALEGLLESLKAAPAASTNNSSAVYFRIKSYLCVAGGQAATEMAIQEIGDADYSGALRSNVQKAVPRSASLALKFWGEHRKTGIPKSLEEKYLIDHQKIRALGAAGKIKEAADIVLAVGVSYPPGLHSDFWYDSARVMATLAANPSYAFAKKPREYDLNLLTFRCREASFDLLERAMRAGFDDLERARNSPDFERIRLDRRFDNILKRDKLNSN